MLTIEVVFDRLRHCKPLRYRGKEASFQEFLTGFKRMRRFYKQGRLSKNRDEMSDIERRMRDFNDLVFKWVRHYHVSFRNLCKLIQGQIPELKGYAVIRVPAEDENGNWIVVDTRDEEEIQKINRFWQALEIAKQRFPNLGKWQGILIRNFPESKSEVTGDNADELLEKLTLYNTDEFLEKYRIS